MVEPLPQEHEEAARTPTDYAVGRGALLPARGYGNVRLVAVSGAAVEVQVPAFRAVRAINLSHVHVRC